MTYSDFLLRTIGTDEQQLFKYGNATKRLLQGQICSEITSAEQQCFVDIVDKIAPKRKAKILDVGPGVVAHSSILLGQDKYNVRAMDKYFWLSDKCLEKLNVDAVSKYLTKDIPVDDYDMVVGRLPCSAIDTIVYLCSKYNKPYFIKTCDCEIPPLDYFYKKWNIDKSLPIKKQPEWVESVSGKFCSLETPVVVSSDDWFSWEKLLPELDKDICFCESYAYNVGSKCDIPKLIKKISAKKNKEITRLREKTVMNVSVANSNKKWFVANDEKEKD